MNNIVAFLQSLIKISEQEITQLISIADFKQYPKEAVIFKPGIVCNEVFLMTQGLVRCHYLLGDKEVNLRLLGDNRQ
ncbi:MAG: hypothetical protein COB51_05725 [Moraxellaceae bacterium]|nr:MAG: hypothetical protein COB51_05725 [Moraxellaceae bacterium]